MQRETFDIKFFMHSRMMNRKLSLTVFVRPLLSGIRSITTLALPNELDIYKDY